MCKEGYVFIGHITNDDILYRKNGICYNNQEGGSCLYAALGASLWDNNITIISYKSESANLEKLLSYIKNKGIQTKYIKAKKGYGINLLIQYDLNGERSFLPKEFSGNYYDWAPKAKNIPKDIIKNNKIFHIGPLPVEIQMEIIEKVRGKSRVITLDPDILDLTNEKLHIWETLLRKIDYFLISEIEMKKFLNFNNHKYVRWDTNAIFDICENFSIKNLILKMGKSGVYAIDNRRKEYIVGAYQTQVVDCTGAGDAFAGGFCYGINRLKKMQDALICGSVSSSLAIEGKGVNGLKDVNFRTVKKRFYTMRGDQL